MINRRPGTGGDVAASLPAFEGVARPVKVEVGESLSWVRTGVDDGQFVFMLCSCTAISLIDRSRVRHGPALAGIARGNEVLVCAAVTNGRRENCCSAVLALAEGRCNGSFADDGNGQVCAMFSNGIAFVRFDGCSV